jgi:DNA-binding CsgD family transcriptional regulator
VNNQLAEIYRKLGINSKAALINYMRELRCDVG